MDFPALTIHAHRPGNVHINTHAVRPRFNTSSSLTPPPQSPWVMNKKADHSVQLKRSENASRRGNRWTHLSSGLLAQLWNIFSLSLLNSKQKSYYGSFVFCVVILLVRCVFEACHLSHWFHGFFSDSLPSPGCIFCRRYSRIQRWPLLVMFASISSSVSTPSSPHPLYTSLVSSTRMTRWEKSPPPKKVLDTLYIFSSFFDEY